jgi:hypothetical protein
MAPTSVATATAPGTKRCPGLLSLGMPAHELEATAANFAANKTMPDGFGQRCRPCDRTYMRAWGAAKKAGEKFSAREGAEVPPSVLAALEVVVPLRVAQELVVGEEPSAPPPPPEPAGLRGLKIAGVVAPDAVSAAPATVAVVSPLRGPDKYADELARRARRGKAEGYTAELVGDTWHALPGDAVSTPEGQAALARVNEARAVERRRRDAERKRAERAAQKAGYSAAELAGEAAANR